MHTLAVKEQLPHWMSTARFLYSEVRPPSCSMHTLASKEQLPRWMSTARFLYSDGRLKGVQPSSGSTAISVSGADAVEAIKLVSDGPKLASITVYALLSAPLPYAHIKTRKRRKRIVVSGAVAENSLMEADR